MRKIEANHYKQNYKLMEYDNINKSTNNAKDNLFLQEVKSTFDLGSEL